ncbi:uncharacterized protein LOC113365398, partial [Ctenocephalides felis]|uniref:uncharacterized protein LOC113365398 n=1 Tax=Ctenocephalides felis TaxID=7515 RepID=UPI000E6E3915
MSQAIRQEVQEHPLEDIYIKEEFYDSDSTENEDSQDVDFGESNHATDVTIEEEIKRRLVNDNKEVIKRAPKTHRRQYELYVNFLIQNKPFAVNPPGMHKDYFQRKWNELTNLLNTCGHGPKRTKECWMKIFGSWRNQTKAKARRQRTQGLATGSYRNTLTVAEMKALQLWGSSSYAIEGKPIEAFPLQPESVPDETQLPLEIITDCPEEEKPNDSPMEVPVQTMETPCNNDEVLPQPSNVNEVQTQVANFNGRLHSHTEAEQNLSQSARKKRHDGDVQFAVKSIEELMEKQIAAINQIGNEMSRFATAVEQLAETNRA